MVNLKNKFKHDLEIKIKFVKLVANNYEQKLEDFDINYNIINNLINQKNFSLPKLEFNLDDSLEKKYKICTDYLKNVTQSQFMFYKNEANYATINS